MDRPSVVVIMKDNAPATLVRQVRIDPQFRNMFTQPPYCPLTLIDLISPAPPTLSIKIIVKYGFPPIVNRTPPRFTHLTLSSQVTLPPLVPYKQDEFMLRNAMQNDVCTTESHIPPVENGSDSSFTSCKRGKCGHWQVEVRAIITPSSVRASRAQISGSHNDRAKIVPAPVSRDSRGPHECALQLIAALASRSTLEQRRTQCRSQGSIPEGVCILIRAPPAFHHH
uniref:Uncharacterized protein n=1 Tax=Physcomitrium patens TaxID=3218 RepID=A0A2K1J2P8_PHYPA|nr:hypothetical protein PHYPA_021650 [Physcomitrium patens]